MHVSGTCALQLHDTEADHIASWKDLQMRLCNHVWHGSLCMESGCVLVSHVVVHDCIMQLGPFGFLVLLGATDDSCSPRCRWLRVSGKQSPARMSALLDCLHALNAVDWEFSKGVGRCFAMQQRKYFFGACQICIYQTQSGFFWG